MLIAAFVIHELSYDRYVPNAANIYRVTVSVDGNGSVAVYPNVDVAVGEGMQNAYPGIKAFARISPASDFVKYQDRQFKEDHLSFADSNFLSMFSIPLIRGNASAALTQPNCVVITRAMAKKYFGEDDPLGKTLEIGLRNGLYKVTGVIDEVPENSHFHFDAFMSMATFQIRQKTWSNIGFYTYVVLDGKTKPEELESRFPELVAKYVVPEVQRDMGVSLAEAQKSVSSFRFSLFPLTDIHLRSNTKSELEANGDMQYVYIFSALAIFILLLACVNFTNLSTARALKRAREIGVRKVLGSLRKQLVVQFLVESVLFAFLAMACASVLLFLLLPWFNQIAGKNIPYSFFLNFRAALLMVGVSILAGVLAGLYPAFFLSSFNTTRVLKGSPVVQGSGKKSMRRALVVFQFFVSTSLIIATIIVYQQLHYMQNKKLGYDKEQVLYLPDARLLGPNQDAFREKLLQDSRVASATISRSIPGGNFMDGTEIYPKNENANGTEIHTNIYHVDYDYLRTLGIQVVRGRDFSKAFPTDSFAVVINESAVRELGWNNDNAIGKSIVRSGQLEYKVIGMVKDFNYASPRQKVAPLMMMLGGNYGGLVVKINSRDIPGFLNNLKSQWTAFNPPGPLAYVFLDEQFARLYGAEKRTQQIFSAFAILAVVIACLGLFGLSAFVIEQRTKEIGIRKVLGASVQTVFVLVSGEFLLLVAIAFLVSIPVAWWAMDKWLEDFAYRIHMNAWAFALAGLAVLLIALLTISLQSARAAYSNPVRAIRTE
jgi:putative ABC transport system permease protein